MADARAEVAAVFRAEHGRAVATLARLLGDIGLAEEAVQDAFVVALERWPDAGLPPNPGGWIVTTARRRAVDRFRRESTREARHAQALLLQAPDAPEEVGPVQDDRLRLLFTCCHPALRPGPGGPDPAVARRPGDRRDRAGVPRPRGDARPAAGARQAQDP